MEVNQMNAAILTCSSLRTYVDIAQQKMNTDYPVVIVDRIHHVDPDRMKKMIQEELEKNNLHIDTLLVAMGFCGGVWNQVRAVVRTVIPRVDDCVSMLLATDSKYIPNRKQTGHLYLYEEAPKDFSAFSLLRDYVKASDEFKGIDKEYLFRMWFDQYYFLDIIDTGYNNCYEEKYVEQAQENADMIHAALDYVPGSNIILEKLVSGNWDEQFLIAKAGDMIQHGDFF